MQRGLVEARLRRDGAEAQRIHDGDGTRAHGEDVAQDAANPGGRALEGLDERRMIVRLDLEGAGPAIADVDDAGVLHPAPAPRDGCAWAAALGARARICGQKPGEFFMLAGAQRKPVVLPPWCRWHGHRLDHV